MDGPQEGEEVAAAPQIFCPVCAGDAAADGGRAEVVRLCVRHGEGTAGDAHGRAGRDIHAQEEQGMSLWDSDSLFSRNYSF